MSVFDSSMEPMVDMFIYEATTLLEHLDEILLTSEKSHDMSVDDINEIFRIMHTLKSSSAMMGLNIVSNVAHRMEDMFFIIRENPHKMHARNSEVVFDLLFQASDFLKSEIEHIQQDPNYTPADADALVAVIEGEVAAMRAEEAPAPQPAVAAQASPAPSVNETDGMYHIRVFFEDDCQMENIRAFMLMSQLKDCCDVLDSVPKQPEANSDCCAEIIKNGLLLHLRPANSIQEIYSIIESAINVKSYAEEDDAPLADDLIAPKTIIASTQPDSLAAPVGEDDAGGSAGVTAQAVSRLSKQSLISVNQLKLDQLMDIMGEIVIAESMVASNPDLKGLTLDNFHKSSRQLRKLTDQLQDIVMSIRMVPLAGTFQKMNRVVRDMSKRLGKEVELITLGGDTEVDKTINDVLGDPFMHMIRNAMDHAIEPAPERLAAGKPAIGHVTISAQSLGSEIIITVADDGRGLDKSSILKKARKNGILTKAESEYTDKEIYGLIMLPGFSTNEVVTEFSGRGVGMDVVCKNLEDVNGNITVESVWGKGTTFTLKIPLTLAIVDGMVVTVSKDTFTIPITSIKQTFKLSEDIQLFQDTENNEMIMMRGQCLPIIRLHSVYNIQTDITELADGIFILVENEKKAACIFVDALVGEQQVVVKPFPQFLNRYDIKSSGLAGCTIMGDGSISLILDINNFLDRF